METRIQKKRQAFVAVAASFLLLGIAFAPTATLAIDNNNSNEDYHSFAYSHNVTKTRAREKRMPQRVGITALRSPMERHIQWRSRQTETTRRILSEAQSTPGPLANLVI